MTDLDKLIDAVKAGTLHEMPYGGMPMATKVYPLKDSSILAAYHGHLGAWLALHEAMLPGYDALVRFSASGHSQANIFMVAMPTTVNEVKVPEFCGVANTPARAGLLATLKEYRAQVTP